MNFALIDESSVEPKKLVPRSERNWVTGPCRATKRLSALIKDELESCSIISMWIARVTKQVNSNLQLFAQHFLL